ncbi:hypothetical protein HDU98_012180 [Podochytrium sp. JEL0797]|nr:hypothetical protein HDU98_012180 [Podochytrium sp. JEL0797]
MHTFFALIALIATATHAQSPACLSDMTTLQNLASACGIDVNATANLSAKQLACACKARNLPILSAAVIDCGNVPAIVDAVSALLQECKH